MRATCPECGATGHVSAYFADDDGKRMIAAVVDLPAELQRPALSYLGLFKPAKNSLSVPRATRLVLELQQLVATGNVCRDERGGVRRAATPAMWAEGIEQMLANRAGLTLPLANHNYLRAVVFGIADQVDARAERQLEQQRLTGQHRSAGNPTKREQAPRAKYDNHITYLQQRLQYGDITKDEFNQAVAEARERHGIAATETHT